MIKHKSLTSRLHRTTALTIDQAKAWYWLLMGDNVNRDLIPEDVWKRTVVFAKSMTFQEFVNFNHITLYEGEVR